MALIKCPQCDEEISNKAEKCPKCGKNLKDIKRKNICCECGAELEYGETEWHNCGCPVEVEQIKIIPEVKQTKNTAENKSKAPLNKEKACKITKIITIIFISLGVIFLCMSFYKKNSYSNPDSDSAYSYNTEYTNSYVGGDAYNYIINGTYFTGYAVLGMGSLIIASITGTATLRLSIKLEENNYE